MQSQPITNFLKKLSLDPNGCVVWIGAINAGGYGVLGIKEKHWKAHRFSFELFKGKIKEGFVIDHICRNRACVNPEHLRQVTHKQNALENSNSVTATNANKTKCIRGHKFSGKNLKITTKGERDCRECRKIYMKVYRKKQR